MDERSLILNAIKQKITPQEDPIDPPGTDAMDKWVKRKKQEDSFRRKDCNDWNNADFLRYLDFMLKEFGARRAKGNLRVDSNHLNRVYDCLASRLQDKMNNRVFKNYLDWWCSIWAPRLTGSEIYLTSLLKDYLIKRFVSRYSDEESCKEILPQSKAVKADDDSIYDLGGLELLVMQRGIIVGYQMLRHRLESDPAYVMRKTLSHFTKDTLINVMNITVQQGPYSRNHTVDFLMIAHPFLHEHNLVEIYSKSDKDLFREYL